VRKLAGYLVAVVMSTQAHANGVLNDPMRPARQSTTAPAVSSKQAAEPVRSWILNSTLVSGERAVAVVNDQLVGIGDRVAHVGYTDRSE